MRRRQRMLILGFWLVVVAHSILAGVFIYRSSAVVGANEYVPETKRYFVLADDMMISMRFARNLAHGDGLVWNPGGERVEGFTNPLWVGWMAVVHLVESDSARTSLWIQISCAVILTLNLLAVRKLVRALDGNAWAVLLATGLTAFYWPLNYWSLNGHEVGLLTLMTTIAVGWAVTAIRDGQSPLRLYLLLGLSTLVRIDMVVPAFALISFMLVAHHPRRSQVLLGGLIVLAFLVSQTLLRYWYYGEWLPNTYYLKMTGYPLPLRMWHGLWFVIGQVYRDGAPAIVAASVLLWRPWRQVGVLAWLILAALAYTVYIGGDTYELFIPVNRFLCQVSPLLFVLLALSLCDWFAKAQILPDAIDRANALRLKTFLGMTLAALVLFADLSYDPLRDVKTTTKWILLGPTGGANTGKIHDALYLDAITTQDAVVAVSAAGIVPYFCERSYVDLLGKSDAIIARRSMRRDVSYDMPYYPGHMKWDYSYSIGKLHPDIVLDIFASVGIEPYLESSYVGIRFPDKNVDYYARADSKNVRWEQLRVWLNDSGSIVQSSKPFLGGTDNSPSQTSSAPK